MKMKSLLEVNSGRVTDRVRKTRGNLRADGQEADRRLTRRDELAQHSEVLWFSRGGKSEGGAGEQRVLSWGDPCYSKMSGTFCLICVKIRALVAAEKMLGR